MQVPSTSLSKSNPLSGLAFDELLALADAAWAHSNAFLPGNDEGKTDQYPSILTSKSYCMDDTLTNPTNKLLSHHHLSSLEQHSIIHEHDNPQGTSCTTCCNITTSQVAPPIPDNGIRAERRPAEAMQMNKEGKYQGKKMINASAIRIDNNGTPLGKEAQPKRTQKLVSPKPAQSNNDQTEKSMRTRRKISPTVVTVVESTKNMMPESAKSCCNRYLNFDKGASNESSADKENATVHPGIEIGVVAPEMNAGIACELNKGIPTFPTFHRCRRSARPRRPSFTVTLSDYSATASQLDLLSDFAAYVRSTGVSSLWLRGPSGGQTACKLLVRDGPKRRAKIGMGWKTFCRENGLTAGNELKFKFLNPDVNNIVSVEKIGG